MTLRLSVVLAIAYRDLSSQFRGRRGWLLPLIAAVLLAPLAATPLPSFTPPPPGGALAVRGEVPEDVAALPSTAVVDELGIDFRQVDGRLEVHAPGVPSDIRRVLDEGDSGRPVEHVSRPDWPLPGRSLLLALLASSILTGAVSESLPGERSRKTLEALLTAAVSRLEIVVGKWLAWAGFGALCASLAGLVAVLAGTMEPGWWLAVLPTVPMGTVALGLFLVRRARDVVGGATVSLRVLPAVLSILGIVAWFVGLTSPILGALVPLGGGLVAAGGTWSGVLPPLISIVLTLAGVVALLGVTARDLERVQRPMGVVRLATELLGLVGAAGAWWLGLGAAAAWSAAGNPTVSAELVAWPALGAASLGLFAMTAIRSARDSAPLALMGVGGRGTRVGWLLVPVAVAVLASAWWLPTELGPWLLDRPTLAFLAGRSELGAWPVQTSLVLGVASLVIQEVAFRGWLQRTLGPIASTLAFVLVVTPFDPVAGLILGAALAGLTRLSNGSVWPAIVARIGAAVFTASTPWLAAALGT